MELASTTVQPLAHYDLSQPGGSATESADEPLAGPSTADVTAATTAFKKELEDRTFDVDDEEFELEQAFERGQEESDTSDDDAADRPEHPLKPEASHTSRQADSGEENDSHSSSSEPAFYDDVFPEEIADSMIQELKEIGMFRFIQKYVVREHVRLPKLLAVFGVLLPADAGNEDPLYLLRVLKVIITRTLRNRKTLPQYGTPSAFIDLLRKSQNIVVLTGAGISTNCGIPDFRSPTGIYARLVASGQYPELSDPQEMFDIEIFKEMPDLFYSFAKELYPDTSEAGGKKRAGAVHHWIRSLELQGKLLRNYTQNIDTLEKVAGIEKVLYAHGSFATCSCLICHEQYPGDTIRGAVFAQTVPLCPKCSPDSGTENETAGPPKKKSKPFDGNGNESSETEDWRSEWHNRPILKPDITFFGQPLDDAFDKCLIEDRDAVDLLIVIGTSLQVAPVSELLSHIPHRVPQVLINRDPVSHVMDRVDLALLGDCDKVIEWIQSELASDKKEEASDVQPRQLFDEIGHVWALEGANLEHKWIQKVTDYFAEEESHEEEDDQPAAHDTA